MRVLPTMDKSATFSEMFKEATALFEKGLYRKALPKFEMALTATQDEKSMIDARFWIISCNQRLREVRLAEYSGLG